MNATLRRAESLARRIARRVPPVDRLLRRVAPAARRVGLLHAAAPATPARRPSPTTTPPQARTTTPPAPAPAWKPTPEERLELRRQHIFSSTNREGHFLEIGPSHHPILPRRAGYDTQIVDHLDREGLVAKYAGFAQYDPEMIEEVDHVVSGGPGLADAIADRFDLVLASHVIEHATSLVHFLQDCGRLLRPDGVLALVIPDSRYVFDRFRERSSIGRVVDTYFSAPPVHTPGTMAEFYLRAVRHRGTTSWVAHHRGDYTFVHRQGTARQAMERALDTSTYVDAHNWVFTPHHFRLLIEELYELGLCELRETHFGDTVGHEFYVNLTLHGPGPALGRDELLNLADVERRVDDPTWASPAEA